MDENGCLYVKYELYVKYCYAGFVSEAPAVGQSTPAVSQEDSDTDSTLILSDESPQRKRSRPNRSEAHATLPAPCKVLFSQHSNLMATGRSS